MQRFHKPTEIEKRMHFFLKELGCIEGEDYEREVKIRLINNSTRIFDFYFPNKRLAIECDGQYWHKNQWKDKFKDLATNWSNIKVVRFKEEEILKHPTAVIKALKLILKQ